LVAPLTSQVAPNAVDDASGWLPRHCLGSVAPAQSNMFIDAAALCARQPVVACSATCVATAGEMLGKHVVGAGSSGRV
jgi:hypothetical protein